MSLTWTQYDLDCVPKEPILVERDRILVLPANDRCKKNAWMVWCHAGPTDNPGNTFSVFSIPMVATIKPDPTFVLGVAGKTIGMNQYPTLDKAMAEAKRLANKENAAVNVYDSRHRLEQFQASHYIVNTVLPDKPKTLADVEVNMVYPTDGDPVGRLCWKTTLNQIVLRFPSGEIVPGSCSGPSGWEITGPCLGHVRDVFSLVEHLDPAVNGCGPANPPETPDSCPKTLADVPPLHCYRDRTGLMVWVDRRGVARFRTSDGYEVEYNDKPENIRIVGQRIDMEGVNHAD